MGQIEDYRLFVLIVENASLSKAADVLKIAKSAVSRRLKLLEERFDAVLIEREAGHWAVSPKGEELYQRVKPLVAESEEINEDFTSSSSRIEGPLRISAPLHLGQGPLMEFFVKFQKNNPEITPTIDLEDRLIDLETEDYDFAIRAGRRVKENAYVKQLGTAIYKIVASPEYLENYGVPRFPKDLKTHRILNYGSEARVSWHFRCLKSDAAIEVKLKPRLSSNSGFVLLPAAKAGLGIGNLPEFVFQDALEKGELNVVLDEYLCDPLKVYIMRSSKRRMNKRMRIFLEALGNEKIFD